MFDGGAKTEAIDTPAVSARQEIEFALVGGLLKYPTFLTEVAATVQPGHIGDNRARMVYSCMSDLFAFGKPVDPVLVSNELQNRKALETIGGYRFLRELVDTCPIEGNVPAYAAEVRKAAVSNERLGAVPRQKDQTRSGASPGVRQHRV